MCRCLRAPHSCLGHFVLFHADNALVREDDTRRRLALFMIRPHNEYQPRSEAREFGLLANASKTGERLFFWNLTDSAFFQVAGCLCLDEFLSSTSSVAASFNTFNMAGPKSSSKPSSSSSDTSVAVSTLWKSYLDQTPERLKFIDAFQAFIVLSGVLQFMYCVLVTNYPFNAFLSG